jgi:predicted GIY-YIG superfamily endonuclease
VSAAVEDWFVYILRCADNTLYTGITKDIERRCKQHNAAVASKYTRARLPVVLVYQETVSSHGDALRRELAIKKLNRAAKAAMCSAWTAK